MKVASIILTVLSFLAAAVSPLTGMIMHEPIIPYVIVGVALFVLLGFIGHVLICKYRTNNGGGGTFVYIITFPAYILPFIVIYAVILLLQFIDFLCDAFFDKRYVSALIAFLKENLLGTKSSAKRRASGAEAYVVIENGYERELSFIETKQDADPDSPLYTKHYNRFRDDTGKYWRSYDNNQTFVKETAKQTGQGY